MAMARERFGGAVAKAMAGLTAVALLVGCQSDRTTSGGQVIVASPTTCDAVTVSIYFDRRSARLTGEAVTLLSAAAKRAHRCRVDSIDITGVADAPDAPEQNAALSRARARSIARALNARGFPAFSFKPGRGDGASAPAVDPGSFRRRADVVFHLSPRP
jgi:outer membrane protein OmpA-like peptidoglycan-associated protein